MQLSSIKALAGNPGQTSFIMGSITQPEDGRYYLEDLSASIPIDLSDAVTTTGFYTGRCATCFDLAWCQVRVHPSVSAQVGAHV